MINKIVFFFILVFTPLLVLLCKVLTVALYKLYALSWAKAFFKSMKVPFCLVIYLFFCIMGTTNYENLQENVLELLTFLALLVAVVGFPSRYGAMW
jgi:signal transduction histidine kinase